MGSIETNREDQAASFSWWWDSHNHPHQSQWLEATLSDLNEKTKLMLNIIEEDGDSFAKRAEMFYKRKPKLINLLEDFYKSHRSLAEKYDQLRSELIQASHLRSFSSLHSLKVQTIHRCEKEVKALKTQQAETDQESYEESDGEKMWDEKISELIDENIQQQAELIRRNKYQNETIQKLRDENKRLKSPLAGHKADDLKRQNQSQFSRSKSKGPSFLGRLTGCTGS
ncbi:unnamed protein product [Prunus armeniaca]|uniref:NAB domain-containing protein n=1 Tax=Prunus armeniaca TaxID=36596 RepID=A0A6J5TK36_PRUAR|nr:unnamed protein product [Prunus armeniaca]CAB4294701.1 unnamed protein product [Prunus armeniaca]